MNEGAQTYVAVYRTESALILKPNEVIKISEIPVRLGPATLKILTYHKVFGAAEPAPHKMQLEVHGPAENIDEAKASFLRVASHFSAMISFLGNGYVDPPSLFLIYETTESKDERDFIQQHIPDPLMQLEQARPLSIKLITNAIGNLGQSESFSRVLRSVSQYQQALVNWRVGSEILAAEHLWIAVETLTPVIRNRLMKESGITEPSNSELAKALGIEVNQLDPHIRRECIFQGNALAYSSIRKASEGFEHGYMDFDEIRGKAIEAADDAVRLIREAILRETAIPEEISAELQDEKYARPLMRGKFVKELRGTLINTAGEIDGTGATHPNFAWRTVPKGVTSNDDGTFSYTFDEKLDAKFPGPLQLKDLSMRIWGPPSHYNIQEDSADDSKVSFSIGGIDIGKSTGEKGS